MAHLGAFGTRPYILAPYGALGPFLEALALKVELFEESKNGFAFRDLFEFGRNLPLMILGS